MKKPLSTRGAAALLALTMGFMGQSVAQATHIDPKPAQPTEDPKANVDCFEMYGEYGRNAMNSWQWAECTGLITKDQIAELYNIDEWSLPNEVMTISRGRLLEYLYHLAGSPEVKNLPEKSPYTDLTPDDARYKVAIWATRVGLTTGWSDGSFHYDTPASRGAYFTFLYRAAGSPKVTLEPLGMAKREDYDLPMNFNYPSADYVTWDAYRVPDFYFASHRTIFIPLMILDSHEELAPIVARLQSLS